MKGLRDGYLFIGETVECIGKVSEEETIEFAEDCKTIDFAKGHDCTFEINMDPEEYAIEMWMILYGWSREHAMALISEAKQEGIRFGRYNHPEDLEKMLKIKKALESGRPDRILAARRIIYGHSLRTLETFSTSELKAELRIRKGSQNARSMREMQREGYLQKKRNG